MKCKLSKAIHNVITNQYFDCILEPINSADLKNIKKHFDFNWVEISRIKNINIVKLTVAGNYDAEGLIAFRFDDGFIDVVNVERRNYRVAKVYENVVKALFYYVVKLSFGIPENDGYIGLNAKGNLIEYYERELGAKLVFRTRMEIRTANAKKILSLFYEKD